jgi:hypothetical protein
VSEYTENFFNIFILKNLRIYAQIPNSKLHTKQNAP